MTQPNPFRRDVVVTAQTVDRMEKTIRLLFDRLVLRRTMRMLDCGPDNELRHRIANVLGCRDRYQVDGTGCQDLDDWTLPVSMAGLYDAVFAFDILEHVFSPLLLLQNAKRACKPGGQIFVSTPRRPSFLRFDGHFHEFDDYRWQALVDRAGLRIVGETRFRIRRGWRHSIGLRPLIRHFTERVYFAELHG